MHIRIAMNSYTSKFKNMEYGQKTWSSMFSPCFLTSLHVYSMEIPWNKHGVNLHDKKHVYSMVIPWSSMEKRVNME